MQSCLYEEKFTKEAGTKVPRSRRCEERRSQPEKKFPQAKQGTKNVLRRARPRVPYYTIHPNLRKIYILTKKIYFRHEIGKTKILSKEILIFFICPCRFSFFYKKKSGFYYRHDSFSSNTTKNNILSLLDVKTRNYVIYALIFFLKALYKLETRF